MVEFQPDLDATDQPAPPQPTRSELDKFHKPSTERFSSSISDNPKEPVEKNVQKWLRVPGIKPGRAPVPVIPDWITGRSVYGHIVTDDHRDHFRRLYPDIAAWQSSDPEALVSIASIIHHEAADTTKVYDQGCWCICLIHMDHSLYYPYKIADWRLSKTFMDALENTLGITEEPKWYPCYSP